jgi:hypothetical protein
MSAVDEFLSTTLNRLIQAEQALLLNGDLAPWLAMWSTQEPVTLFGVDATTQGADEERHHRHTYNTLRPHQALDERTTRGLPRRRTLR